MAEPDDQLQQTIAALRAGYADALPGKIAEIEALWQRLTAGGAAGEAAGVAQEAALDDLVRIAHGIAGAGATFGFAGASDAARELERFLDQIRAAGRPADRAERERVAALIVDLRKVMG